MGNDATSVPLGADELFGEHYRELRRMAHGRLRRSGDLTLLDTTSLVNEVYLKLSDGSRQHFRCREHFLAYASTAMCSIIVDFARARSAERRGGHLADVTLDTVLAEQLAGNPQGLVEIDDALKQLAATEPRLVCVVEMRFFGGFSEDEIAAALDVSSRTVKRDWDKARLMLLAMLSEGE